MRHTSLKQLSIQVFVSIHAPREGCDGAAPSLTAILREFQFTHPGRGATNSFSAPTGPTGVSIHAPREGCDTGVVPSELYGTEFQFTHPGRGATWKKSPRNNLVLFQFTHPGRGATTEQLRNKVGHSVSIHAPREGCDFAGKSSSSRISCFNSRTPGGVRLGRYTKLSDDRVFQFTHPGRGATPTETTAA